MGVLIRIRRITTTNTSLFTTRNSQLFWFFIILYLHFTIQLIRKGRVIFSDAGI